MVETYKGPIPQFPKSPTAGATPGPSSRAQQRGRQAARPSEGPSSSRAQDSTVEPAGNFAPATGAAQPQQQTQAYGGVAAADLYNPGQNITPRLTNTADETTGPAGNPILYQPGIPDIATSVGDFFGLNASSTGLASGDFEFSTFDFLNDEDLTGRSPIDPGASHADFMPALGGQQVPIHQAHGATSVNNSLRPQMGNSDVLVSTPLNYGHITPSATRAGPGVNHTSDGFRQRPSLPDLPNFIADIPVQSVEREQSSTAAARGAQACTTANDVSPATPGHHHHNPHHHHQQPTPCPEFPPGYTAANAVYRDTHGVWYYDSHDTCHVSLGHRHDWDGGVHFSGDVSVTQSFASMHQREGIGFLLGLAAGQVLHGTGRPSEDRLQAATEIARCTLPGERQGSVAVPNAEVVQRMMDVNGQLPGNHYYEPFTNRVVQYDMPPGLASQNGKQGNDTGNRSHQGAGASG